jgi:hypothetical protein
MEWTVIVQLDLLAMEKTTSTREPIAHVQGGHPE